jgi:hypothetical protein
MPLRFRIPVLIALLPCVVLFGCRKNSYPASMAPVGGIGRGGTAADSKTQCQFANRDWLQ